MFLSFLSAFRDYLALCWLFSINISSFGRSIFSFWLLFRFRFFADSSRLPSVSSDFGIYVIREVLQEYQLH